MSRRRASSAIGTGFPPGRAPSRASSASAWIAYRDFELIVIKDLSLKRGLSLLLPPFAMMAVIFVLSAQTADPDHPFLEVVLRKLAHVTEYAVLTFAWVRAVQGLFPQASLGQVLAASACISLLYAGTDEFHQTFVSGRHGTPVDVLIDSVGIAIACWFVSAQARRRRRTVGPSRPRAA
jgi:VanZ family protein